MEHSFDPWQQEAITISGGRHLVLAPPGCGKTDILSERIVHAHDAGVEYSDMLCLTFTNRAAKGMAQRIADRTGNPVPDSLFVGNIHRYCSQMLFAEGIVHHNTAIIDEGDVDNIIQEDLCKRFDVQTHTTELMRLQHVLWQLTLGIRGELLLHGELLRSGTMTRLCDVLGRPHSDDSLADIYLNINSIYGHYSTLAELPAARLMMLARAYQDYKQDNDLLDYDDLLVLAYSHISSHHDTQDLPEAPSSPRRYRWIEVDEVQDLNALQLALIDLLGSPDATIVYLGDEQQAIFSFIGAKMETLEWLKRRCGDNIHHLHTNYRSPRYLLNLQNDYAVRNLHIDRRLLPDTPSTDAQPPSPQDLCLLDVGDAELSAYYTARFARRYGEICAADATGNDRVAILVSTNREADDVGQTMSAMGIDHFKISGTDLFSTPTVRLLLSHLSVLTDENVFIAWARLLWGLKVSPSYTAARATMRDLRRLALLPSDFLLYPGSSYLQQFVQVYDNEELVIFDTETTGLDPRHDDIIQIAAIRVRQGRVVGTPFNILLETDRELPATVGGHPNPMLDVYRRGPRCKRADGLRRFIDYCRGKVLVGHNVEYDYQILYHNLSRCCPDLSLTSLCPRYFDTLKYIRLVRPRLRHYRLEHLLEVLHLQGQNSHRADDDIMATLSLLTFCHTAALPLIAEQRLYLVDNAKTIEKFNSRYAELYSNARQSLYREGTGIVAEMQRTYTTLVDNHLAEPLDKWRHLVHYLEADLIKADLYPTLRTQLERYVTDLCTTKEADLCGGSLQERYIISTVHKAKGLEFDTVIVYRAIDGSYPGSRSWTDKQIQEDARRLFVALSRSKKRLCVVYDSHYKSTPHTLSPFLEKVKGHFTVYRRNPDGHIATLPHNC